MNDPLLGVSPRSATASAGICREKPVWQARRNASVRLWLPSRAELVAEVKYLTRTGGNLLREVVYEGLREDKPAAEVRRSVPYPKA